jgi:hypothetical protein
VDLLALNICVAEVGTLHACILNNVYKQVRYQELLEYGFDPALGKVLPNQRKISFIT